MSTPPEARESRDRLIAACVPACAHCWAGASSRRRIVPERLSTRQVAAIAPVSRALSTSETSLERATMAVAPAPLGSPRSFGTGEDENAALSPPSSPPARKPSLLRRISGGISGRSEEDGPAVKRSGSLKRLFGSGQRRATISHSGPSQSTTSSGALGSFDDRADVAAVEALIDDKPLRPPQPPFLTAHRRTVSYAGEASRTPPPRRTASELRYAPPSSPPATAAKLLSSYQPCVHSPLVGFC